MPQAFRLDRGRGGPYVLAVVLGLLAGGCRATPDPIAPEGLAPLAPSVAAGWSASVRPAEPTRYRLRWRFTTQQGSAAGRAVVRFQPDDTLRFDYSAPFGRSGAALFVGPEAVWAVPPDELAQLVPTAPLFWASLGLPLAPASGLRVSGLEQDGVRAWRYEDAGGGVFNVVWRPAEGRLLAEFRTATRVVGVSAVQYDSTGRPATAELQFPGDAARLTFRFEAVETVAQFAPETWRRP